MTHLSHADVRAVKYEKQITIKMTQNMLDNIKEISEKTNNSLSDTVRLLLYHGIMEMTEDY